MPLYQQLTSLQGQGKAPSVNYYAGIKAPKKPDITLPKATGGFNIDLSRIGDAMIQMSRDEKATEIELAKIEADKQHQAAIEAEKQMKIDASNAYAKALSDIAAEVDQQGLSPLVAARRMREVDDQFRAPGILSASEMATIKNSWDSGIGSFQEDARKKWQTAEIEYKASIVNDYRKRVPEANNWTNDQVFSRAIQAEYIANNARDGIAKFNLMPNDTTKQIALNAQQAQSDYQAGTSILNSFGSTLKPTDMLQNVYENSYLNAIENGWGEAEAQDVALQSVEKAKPIVKIIEDGTKSDKEFLENKIATRAAQGTWNLMNWDFQGYMQSKYPHMEILSEDNRLMRNPETGDIIRIRPPRYETEKTDPTERIVETETSVQRNIIPGTPTGYIVLEDGRRVYAGNIDVNADGMFSQDEVMSAVLNGELGAGVIARPKLQTWSANCQGSECGRNGTYVTQSDSNKTIINNNTEGMVDFLSNNNVQKTVKDQSDLDGVEYPLSSDTMRYAREAHRIIDNDQQLKELGNDSNTRRLSFRNAANGLVVSPSGRIMFSNNLVSFGDGYVSSIMTNSADMPQLLKINEAIQSKPYKNEVKIELARAMVSNNGEMLPLWDPELHGDLRLELNKPEKIAGMLRSGAGKTWNAINHGYRDAVNATVDWYLNAFKTPDEEGLTAEDKAKIIYETFFNQAIKPAAQDIYNSIEKRVKDSEGINTDNFEKEIGRKVESGTIDINSTEDLPIKFNEDGTWSNFKYATIGADGWTYLVPTINMSAKEALEANKYIARFEGEDARAVNNAEQFGQRVRQYLIDKYSAFTEPSGGLENISNLSKNLPENPWLNIEETPKNIQNPEEVKTALKLESKTKEELKNIVQKNIEEYESFEKLGEDIIKVSNDTIKDISDAINETGYRPLNNEEAAKLGFTLFKDKNVVDEWLKIFNNLGKKPFGIARQILYVASSIPPGVMGAVGAGAYKLGSLGGEGIAWLQVTPGLYIPTSKEREFNREMLEAVKNIRIATPEEKIIEDANTAYYQNPGLGIN